MTTVTIDHVCQVLSGWTGIPGDRLRAGGLVVDDAEALRATLANAIVGQDAAIDTTVRAIARRARLGSRAGEKRPLWTALFAGPSGVGKSQLPKELAKALFGDTVRHLIQIDLSDFRDEHTVARLVGAPPGYKGHGDGGELTNALRRVTSGVLLLDEVDKAHPTVLHQVLLPLLGEGTVHDMNDGHVLDASQFLVVMTSNLGSGATATRPVGFGVEGDDPSGSTKKEIVANFPREILSRIDNVAVFSWLLDIACGTLWDREVKAVGDRLSSEERRVEVSVDPAVRDRLLTSGKPSIRAEGARSIRKLVDRAIADKCVQFLEDQPGSIRIHVTEEESGGIRFISRGLR